MNLKPKDFYYSGNPEPHRQRTKTILDAHPEIRNLIGRNPASAIIITSVVTAQLFVAYLLSDSQWWIALLTALFFGAFASHNLYVLIHEAAHNLIFKNRSLNFIAGIIADAPNVLLS
jgi:sphingolipid 4-desaturase/C4-monooxygenase